MSNFNKVIVTGNLCADPELKTIGDDRHVVKVRTDDIQARTEKPRQIRFILTVRCGATAQRLLMNT